MVRMRVLMSVLMLMLMRMRVRVCMRGVRVRMPVVGVWVRRVAVVVGPFVRRWVEPRSVPVASIHVLGRLAPGVVFAFELGRERTSRVRRRGMHNAQFASFGFCHFSCLCSAALTIKKMIIKKRK